MVDKDIYKTLSTHATYRVDSSHPLPDARSALGLFLKKIGDIFNRAPAVDSKLSGRISELEINADTILQELIAFKKKSEKELDPRLFSALGSLIDPIIKEIARLQVSVKRKDGATQQVKIFSRYTVLIDKARFWIQQGKDRAGKKKIQDAVILHIVQDFHERVERDIQLINDYLTHAIDGIDAAIEVKNELRAQLMPMLSPSLLRLYQLRESNEEPSLESLVLWRSKADNSRENLFSSSLHTIDTFFKDFLPTPSKEKESEYMLALLMQLVNLEEKIMGVSDLVNYDVLDNTQRGVTSDMLEKLEQEAHELNRNLRLSDEHGDRVQQSLHIITSLRKKIC